MIRRKLPGTFLVYTLTIVSISLILALAIYKLKIVLLKNDFARENRMIDLIQAESALNEVYGEFLLGKRSPFDGIRKRTRSDSRGAGSRGIENIPKTEYEVSLHKIGKRDFRLDAEVSYFSKSLYFSVVPISDFFQVYQKDFSLDLSDQSLRLDAPIYAPKINLSLRNASLEFVSDYRSPVPNLVSGEDFRVSFGGSNSRLALSKSIPGFGGSWIRFTGEDFTENVPQKAKLARNGVRLQLGKIRFVGNSPYRVSASFPKKRILNPYLNEKTFLFSTSLQTSYATPDLRKFFDNTTSKPRLYFDFENTGGHEKFLLNPWKSSDSYNTEASFDYENGTVTFKDENHLYKIALAEDMVIGANRFLLANERLSFISCGRRISGVYLNSPSNPVLFSHDEKTRVLELNAEGTLKALGYGDGRKTDFPLPPAFSAGTSRPILFFVDRKKVPATLFEGDFGKNMLRFLEAPGYGKLVEVMTELPVLYIAKAKLSPGIGVYADATLDVTEVDLSKIDTSVYDSVYSENSLYLRGEARSDIRVESKEDIYLGDLKLTQKLAVKGRLVFTDAPSGKDTESLYRNLIVATSGTEILPLQRGNSTLPLRGSFLIGGEIKEFRFQDIGPIGPYSVVERLQKLALKYEEDFISKPSKDLLLFVRR